MRYYVHDYLIEDLCSKCINGAFYKNIIFYCSLDQNYIDEKLVKYSICVGNPEGVMNNYLSLLDALKQHSDFSYFIPEKVAVFDDYNEEKIIAELKNIIESVYGRNEQILKDKLLVRLSPVND